MTNGDIQWHNCIVLVEEGNSYSAGLAEAFATLASTNSISVKHTLTVPNVASDSVVTQTERDNIRAALDTIKRTDVFVVVMFGYEVWSGAVLEVAKDYGMYEAPYLYILDDAAAVQATVDVYVSRHKSTLSQKGLPIPSDEELRRQVDGLFALSPTAPASTLRDNFCQAHYASDPLACDIWALLARDSVAVLTNAMTTLIDLDAKCDGGAQQAQLSAKYAALCTDVKSNTIKGERAALLALIRGDTIDFEGVTGNITLSSDTGDRVGSWGVLNVKNGSFSVEIGQVTSEGVLWFTNASNITFPTGHAPGVVPKDSIPSFELAIFVPVDKDFPRKADFEVAVEGLIRDTLDGRVLASWSSCGDPDLDAEDVQNPDRALVVSEGFSIHSVPYRTTSGDGITFDALAVSGIDSGQDLTPTQVHGVVGSMWSSLCERAAALLRSYSTPMISPTATSTSLSNQEAFPTFRRVVGSNYWMSMALVSTIRAFNWTTVHIVRDTESYSSNIYSMFKDVVREANGKIVINGENTYDTAITSTGWDAIVSEIRDTVGSLVILFIGWEPEFLDFARAMHRQKMWGAPYSVFGADVITMESDVVAQLMSEGVDLTGVYSARPVAAPATQSPRRADFAHRYCAAADGKTGVESDCDITVFLAADATHAMVAALDRLARVKRKCRENDAAFPATRMECQMLRDAVDAANGGDATAVITAERKLLTQFIPQVTLTNGTTGVVELDAGGDRVRGGGFGLQNLVQLADGTYLWKDVATTSEWELSWLVDTTTLTWMPGHDAGDFVEAENGIMAPRASPKVVTIVETISPALFGIVCFVSVASAAVGGLLLYFNHRYRERRIIRMSSPKINNLAIASGIVALLILPTWGVDENTASIGTTNDICMARVWLSAVAFTALFASLFAKLARVWRIFRSAEMLEKTTFTLTSVLALIGAGVLVDVIILALWQSDAPLEYRHVVLHEKVDPNNADILHRTVVGECAGSNDHSNVYAIILLTYQAIVLFVGAVLAYQTRDIEIPALNDSRMIGFSVYVCCTVFPVMVFAKYAVDEQKLNAQFGITAFGAVAAILSTMVVMFLPKLLAIRSGSSDVWTQRRSDRDGSSTDPTASSRRTGNTVGSTAGSSTGTGTAGASHHSQTSRDSSTERHSSHNSSTSDHAGEISLQALP
ncbi:MAG: hypothetical protein MHM6MM_007190 [Cercozoa sp. M6MM]